MPGLLDLRTDLKSLKYGNDQLGNGNSGQPYIKVDINDVDRDFNRFRLTNFDDGFIRGGAVGAINASATDTLRIGKFLVDLPKGPLFIAKQVGLQLSNPQIEHINTLPTNRTGTNRPTRGQGLFRNAGNLLTNVGTSVGAFISNVTNRIENTVGPTRVYNLGINTISQIPINAIGGHIFRHGFLPNNDSSKLYESVVTQNNFVNNHNRLEEYAGNFALGGFGDGIRLQDKTIWDESTELTKYISGPGSVYGIGNTLINRYTNTNSKTAIYRSLDFSKSGIGRIADIQLLGPIADAFAPISMTKTGSVFIPGGQFEGIRTPSSIGLKPTLADILWSDSRVIPIQGGISRKTQDAIKIANTYDYGISKISGSTLVDSTFNLEAGLNPDSSFIYKTGLEYTASNPIQGGVSRNTQDKVKIKNTFDYAISEKTESIFSNTGFNLSSTSITPDSSFLFYVASNKDTGSHSRKGNSKPLESQNDLVAQGPSSYPGASSPTTQLDVPNTVYSYSSPSAKTYAAIVSSIQSQQKNSPVPILKGSSNYKYNTGANVDFNRINDRDLDSDEIKVIFTPINPFIETEYPTQFLAYLSAYSEDYNSEWNDISYNGRAESFYVFKKFKKTITFGLQVPCYNQQELIVNHEKLLSLGNGGLGYALAGQYNPQGLLGGIITKLTVGNYIVDSPGILNNMKFSILEESSWDLDLQYAFYLKVDFSFTVIGNELPVYDSYYYKDLSPKIKFTQSVPNKEEIYPPEDLDVTPPSTITTKPPSPVYTTNPNSSIIGPFGATFNDLGTLAPSTPGNFYQYGNQGQILAELDSNGNIIRNYATL